MVQKSEPAPRRSFAGWAAFYILALVPGFVLLAAGISSRLQTEAPPPVGPTVGPDSSIAADIWQATAEPVAASVPVSPAIRTPLPPKTAHGDLSCTDLRALFGLGEPLTDEQRRRLLERC